MIDLHTHTDQSDGTLSPRELVAEAARIGLEALAITDHDTFAGYDQAAEYATRIDLVCGVELSTKYRGRSVHLLAYFPNVAPDADFRNWVGALATSRRERNAALVDELRAKGLRITLEEVSARAGKIVARPHFAAVMVEKGYVSSAQQAFDEYLDESASCVSRSEPSVAEVISRITASGGLPVLPHPGRVTKVRAEMESALIEMQAMGLRGIEVYHSDHSESDIEFYTSIAARLGLAVTGGSDFHGAAKPSVALGTGIAGNVNVPHSVLSDLRRLEVNCRLEVN